MNRLVEEVVIGTMTIESALGYLRRAPNKALITGGDRSDMALTALETSTSVIIFTGGLYPDVRVLAQAEEKGVPVILVHEDTYTTVENLHSVYRSIHPDNTAAIKIVRDLIDKHVDCRPILKCVKLRRRPVTPSLGPVHFLVGNLQQLFQALPITGIFSGSPLIPIHSGIHRRDYRVGILHAWTSRCSVFPASLSSVPGKSSKNSSPRSGPGFHCCGQHSAR